MTMGRKAAMKPALKRAATGTVTTQAEIIFLQKKKRKELIEKLLDNVMYFINKLSNFKSKPKAQYKIKCKTLSKMNSWIINSPYTRDCIGSQPNIGQV